MLRILGALLAIPVAEILRILTAEWLASRAEETAESRTLRTRIRGRPGRRDAAAILASVGGPRTRASAAAAVAVPGRGNVSTGGRRGPRLWPRKSPPVAAMVTVPGH